MSFRFDFEPPEEDNYNASVTSTTESTPTPVDSHQSHDDADGHDEPSTKRQKHHHALTNHQDVFEVKEFYDESIISKLQKKVLTFGEQSLETIDTSTIEEKISEDSMLTEVFGESSRVLSAINSHSDLVAGIYEGGLKVWECGVDLANFLTSTELTDRDDFSRKRIIELGCGAGLPGLCCLKLGAMQVDFQDYNEEVLKLLTYPNVQYNSMKMEQQPNCHFYAGDWSSLATWMEERHFKYDVILTAETIYNEESYSKLHLAFDTLLTSDGVIFVAAKSYYFGVGGSVDAFVEYVKSRGSFDVDTVYSIKSGVHRKILKLTRKEALAGN